VILIDLFQQNGKWYSHMVSDTSWTELHDFAITLFTPFLKPDQKPETIFDWFQKKGWKSHYDISSIKARRRALELGAKIVSTKDMLVALGKLKDVKVCIYAEPRRECTNCCDCPVLTTNGILFPIVNVKGESE
jgi:hypothetical protein